MSGSYGDIHAQLGKILNSAIEQAVYEYDTQEFDRRDFLARKGESMSFELCPCSHNGTGCNEHNTCRILHKKGTDYFA